MNFIRSVILLFAGAIVLLHNLTPHDHCNDFFQGTTEQFSSDTDDFMDPIRLAFHHDIHGNLEQILPADDFQIDFIFPFVVTDWYWTLLQSHHLILAFRVHPDVAIYCFQYSRINTLRGPPVC